jgi:hypothetical protein
VCVRLCLHVRARACVHACLCCETVPETGTEAGERERSIGSIQRLRGQT